MKPRLFCVVLVSLAISPGVVAAAGVVQPASLYFTSSPMDPHVGNPVLFLDPDAAGTFQIRAQLGPNQSISTLNLTLSTPTPGLADCGSASIFNVSIPPGGFRWATASAGSCTGFATGGLGLRGDLRLSDPTYDLDTDSYLLGSFQFVANNFPGQFKMIYIAQVTQGMDGAAPLTTIQLGAGDAAVSTSTGQLSSVRDAGIFINGPVGLRGDYDGSGVVDAADYVVWRNTLGSTKDLRADGDGNGTVDPDDYEFWKANFGASASGARAFAGVLRGGATGPTVEVVDQGATPDGNRSYRLQITTDDPSSAHALELAFEGPIVDVLRLGGAVHRESRADANDGGDGYEKEEDTWYVDSVFDRPNPGDNPFTGTTTVGVAPNLAQNELFVALGSGTDPGALLDVMQVVLPPGGEATFAGLIARGGETFPAAGTIPAPEPGPASSLIALGGVAALARRRRRATVCSPGSPSSPGARAQFASSSLGSRFRRSTSAHA